MADVLERLGYSVGEVAGMLGVSRGTVYRHVKDGEIGTVRIGNRIVIPAAALRKLLTVDDERGDAA
jgi:excisionase family DNA binding protein